MLDHDEDIKSEIQKSMSQAAKPKLKYIVYYFPFKEGNEGKSPSQYPMLHDTKEETASTKSFLTFHGAAISHVEHREPTPQEIVDDIPYMKVRATARASEALK